MADFLPSKGIAMPKRENCSTLLTLGKSKPNLIERPAGTGAGEYEHQQPRFVAGL
jgi:hypothetical protein